MKTPFASLALATLILKLATAGLAQGTAFIYHGQLSHRGRPAQGEHDLGFGLCDAPTNGNQIAIQQIPDVRVRDGAFTVTLDFGDGVFDGNPRWLEITVKNKDGQFIPLTPRQRFMPTPYAIMANTASNLLGALPASQLTGTIPASQLSGTLPPALFGGTYSLAVTFDNAANSFSGNGSGLANVDAATLGGLSAANFWRLTGNAGTTAGVNSLGTTDNQPLEMKVNGLRAFRLEPTTDGPPNVIGGSASNIAYPRASGATIGGGHLNEITDLIFSKTVTHGGIPAKFGTIGGGISNVVGSASDDATIAGGSGNQIHEQSRDSTIGGGSANVVAAQSVYSMIGGGQDNWISYQSPWSTIAGGLGNSFRVGSFHCAIGGGRYNGIAESYDSSISGGASNFIYQTESSIGGGANNLIDRGWRSTIAGGYANRIGYFGPALDGSGGVIGGGFYNAIGAGVSTIGGGAGNRIGTNHLTDAYGGTISGGESNLVTGIYGAIPGGKCNIATNYTFAAGRRAQALHTGSFVWSDSNDFNFTSANTNSFCVRSVGGARFVSGIDASGEPIAGVELAPGGGSWATLSDRNAKENFAPINPREVLERVGRIPISIWNYKSQDAAIRHIGPTAQDFAAAFQVGENNRRITTVDADGVALAAIQGLNQIVKEKDAEIQELKQRLEKLEERFSNPTPLQRNIGEQ